MLRSLHMVDVGPAARFDLDLGPRLNVLTGDNGLGKSFVLDVAWWALTGTWVDRPVLPQSSREEAATIGGEVDNKSDDHRTFSSRFIRVTQSWEPRFHTGSIDPVPGHEPHDVNAPTWISGSAPVLYVRSCGAFSVWDPIRNLRALTAEPFRSVVAPQIYNFSFNDVWDGLQIADKTVCNGLVRDWVEWQLEAPEDRTGPFRMLRNVLKSLSHPSEEIVPGKPVRLYVDDVRRFPTIEMPYGPTPVNHTSAGMRQILALSYMLTWVWTEHIDAVRLSGQKQQNEIVLLVEEPEAHLHPKWQRHIIPALLGVLHDLLPHAKAQLLVTTHSPLVLASIEPGFIPDRDKLFLFELQGRDVTLKEYPWTKYGDATGWLTSDIFDLKEARSVEAERAIKAAYDFMAGRKGELPRELRTEKAIHRELTRLLPAHDPFWAQWVVEARRRREA
jgi:hypothetical protein